MPSVSRRFARTDQRFLRPSSKRDDSLRAPVVLMVSGGADSTALLLLAATSELDIDDGRGTARIARERLHVLHVNHGLRGLDAQEDEEFVRELSARFGIPCTVRRVDVAGLASEEGLGQQAGSNVENVGREVRYREATELANRLCREVDVPRSAARILTAHTADDRAETFLMNAIRGSGPSGLSSIPRRRNRIVRPLLDRTHEELCDLLRMRGIVWREDRTNADTRYLRAFVRHEVMPLLRERNPRLTSGMSASCDILSDEDAYMNQVASRTYRELVRRSSPTMVALDGARLAACEVAIARRVVRKAMLAVCPDARLEARHINRVLSLVAAGSGSASTPMGCDARMEYGLLFVRAQGEKSGPLALWPAAFRPPRAGAGGVLAGGRRSGPRRGVGRPVRPSRRGGLRARPRAGRAPVGGRGRARRRHVPARHARPEQEALGPPERGQGPGGGPPAGPRGAHLSHGAGGVGRGDTAGRASSNASAHKAAARIGHW